MMEKLDVKDKYYTPSIEEFHVGFQYEDDASGLAGGRENWQPSTVMHPNNIIGVQDFLKSNSIRVKYLDKYDIEELGWEYSGMLDVDLHTFKLHIQSEPDTDIAKDYFHLRYEDYTQRILITDGKYEHYRFFGEIKNKSELMILMKQLGI